jgi:hypothetical protein
LSAVAFAHGNVAACQTAGIPFKLDVATFGAGEAPDDIQGKLLHMVSLSFGAFSSYEVARAAFKPSLTENSSPAFTLARSFWMRAEKTGRFFAEKMCTNKASDERKTFGLAYIAQDADIIFDVGRYFCRK